MDKASDFGSEDCRFESCRGRSREARKAKGKEKRPPASRLFSCSGDEPRSSPRRTGEGGRLAAPRASEVFDSGPARPGEAATPGPAAPRRPDPPPSGLQIPGSGKGTFQAWEFLLAVGCHLPRLAHPPSPGLPRASGQAVLTEEDG
ncbi:unnamed protein product [Bubo scandiacus]